MGAVYLLSAMAALVVLLHVLAFWRKWNAVEQLREGMRKAAERDKAHKADAARRLDAARRRHGMPPYDKLDPSLRDIRADPTVIDGTARPARTPDRR